MRDSLTRLALLGTVLLVTASVLSLAAGSAWFAELLTHFRLQYAIGGLTLGALLLGLRRRFAASICLVAALANAWPLLPYLGGADARAAGRELTLAHVNVEGSNRDAERVLEFLQGADADIVVVQEVNAFWAAALEPLDDAAAVSEALVREDNFGLALYSRIPATDIEPLVPGGDGPPGLLARLTVEGLELSVLAMHPMPPISPDATALRDRQLAAVAPTLRDAGGIGIVIGDLNTTPWSPPFRDTVTSAGLRDARLGNGLAATWPARMGPFGIPIDHCLVDDEIAIASVTSGPYVGSDHRGIVCRVTLPPSGRSESQASLKK